MQTITSGDYRCAIDISNSRTDVLFDIFAVTLSSRPIFLLTVDPERRLKQILFIFPPTKINKLNAKNDKILIQVNTISISIKIYYHKNLQPFTLSFSFCAAF